MKIHKLELFDGSIATIKDTENYKALRSEYYNFFFNKKDGFFVRWGKGDYSALPEKITKQEVELYSLWSNIWREKIDIRKFVADLGTDGSLTNTAPEILDWEISECCDKYCSFCYKSNIIRGKNLLFEDFKKAFHKLPTTITTIAYGIGSISLCPDLWKILNYTRAHDIIPTITINGDATESDLDNLAKTVGACAVSVLGDKQDSYNCIQGLTDRGLEQCNIHAVICEETYDRTLEIISDIKTDPRLSKLRALVMLSIKEKGRSVGKFNKLSQEKFDNLFKLAIEKSIGVGCDSCGAAKTFNFINKNKQYEYMRGFIEPCCAGKYSSYLNIDLNYMPCSFAEGCGEWEDGLSILDCKDFMKDIWFHEKVRRFSDDVTKCRHSNIGCPIYDV